MPGEIYGNLTSNSAAMRLVALLALALAAPSPLLGEARRLAKRNAKSSTAWPFTVNQTRPTARPGEEETAKKEPGPDKKVPASLRAKSTALDQGTTVCQCVCGGRVVWHRELFNGNVEEEKETYCRDEVCPSVMVPGLKIDSQCNYHADSREVTGGTICDCDCGSKRLWQGKMFYGDVGAEKERECVEEICPRHAVPGLKSTSKCIFKEDLFAKNDASKLAHSSVVLFGVLVMLAFGFQ